MKNRLSLQLGLLIFFLTLATQSVWAQNWNWPEDRKTAEEKLALYKDNLKLERYNVAAKNLSWFLENAPDINKAIYIDGAEIYQNLADKTSDKSIKLAYVDTALQMYDRRVEYFGDKKQVMNRKVNFAFKQYYKTPAKYDDLLTLFDEAFDVNGASIGYYNIFPYMFTAVNAYKMNKLTSVEVLEIHSMLSEIVESKMDMPGESKAKLKQAQERIDGQLISNVELTCETIKSKFADPLVENPSDLELAKKVVSLSLQFKCASEDFFLSALETVYETEPDAGIAKNIAKRKSSTGEYEMAIKFFNEALEMEEDPKQKADIHMGLANVYNMQGKKASTRDHALKAAQADSELASDAYNMVANLYLGSYQQCKKGESIVDDRAIFLAAYEMFKKAGNQKGMAAAKEQFPSTEELFTEDINKGDNLEVGCWINTTVSAKTRD